MILSILTIFGWMIFISFLISLINSKYKILFENIGLFITFIASLLFSYYAFFYQQSIIQGFIAVITSGIIVLLSYMLITNTLQIRQTKIFITISSGILLLAYTITIIQSVLIYNVANETQFLLNIIGYNTVLESGSEGIYIVFDNELRTEIVMACTGIGSIALFTGFISAIDTIDVKTKLLYITLSSVAIYLLNLIRNLFIAGAYGGQWFHIQPELIEYIFGQGDDWVSFYIADRIIAQFTSVIIMIIFALLIINLIDNNTKLIEEWISIIDYIDAKL